MCIMGSWNVIPLWKRVMGSQIQNRPGYDPIHRCIQRIKLKISPEYGGLEMKIIIYQKMFFFFSF